MPKKHKSSTLSNSHKAYKFRLYPTIEQANKIDQTIGCSRKIYNLLLADMDAQYELDKTMLKREVTYYKSKEEYSYMREVDSLALANAKINLETAFKNFFDKKLLNAKHPTFHKKFRNDSYTTNNQSSSIRIEGNTIKLPKIGFVKVKMHRQIKPNETIKNVTVSKLSGKYYISINVEFEPIQVQNSTLDTNNPNFDIDKVKVIGLDYSSTYLYVDSFGNKANMPKYYVKSQDKLALLQKQLSKKTKGSKRYKKLLTRIQKLSSHIANQRKDFLHKLSNQITNDYDIICVEDLDLNELKVKNTTNDGKKLELGKATSDNGFGMFRNFCSYKALNKDKLFIKVDKYYPSSQLCSDCGYQNIEIKDISIKQWECPICHTQHNRDHNAAINIRKEGLRMFLTERNLSVSTL